MTNLTLHTENPSQRSPATVIFSAPAVDAVASRATGDNNFNAKAQRRRDAKLSIFAILHSPFSTGSGLGAQGCKLREPARRNGWRTEGGPKADRRHYRAQRRGQENI